MPSNRAHGAAGQNRSCSIDWAAKQEKLPLLERCFFLTSTFIELIVHLNAVAATRRRKTAKAKVKLYEQGKLPHDKLLALAKKFLHRKMRALRKSE